MVKRSNRARNSKIRILGTELEIFEKKRRGQESGNKTAVYKEFLEDCWQWETNGQCVKGDNCSFPATI